MGPSAVNGGLGAFRRNKESILRTARAPCCGGRMTIIETFERGCNTAISPDRSNPDRQIMIAIARSRRPNADHSCRLCSIGCELIRPKTRMIPPRRRSIGLNSAEASKPLLISRGTGSLNPFSSSGESTANLTFGERKSLESGVQAARGASGRLMLLRDYIVRIRPVSSRIISADAKADKLS